LDRLYPFGAKAGDSDCVAIHFYTNFDGNNLVGAGVKALWIFLNVKENQSHVAALL